MEFSLIYDAELDNFMFEYDEMSSIIIKTWSWKFILTHLFIYLSHQLNKLNLTESDSSQNT